MKTKNPLKTFLSIALVSVMAATVMPTTASAEEDFPDVEQITVQVELGEIDPDDDGLCDGFAVLNIPNDQIMTAGLVGQKSGTTNPTIEQVLDFFGESLDDLQSPVESVNADGQRIITYDPSYPQYGLLDDGSYGPIVVDGVQQMSNYYNVADRNEDGVIDISENADGFPFAMTLARRGFATDSFEISFDVDDCILSDKLGVLLAYREPLTKYDSDSNSWETAELEWSPFHPSGADSVTENTGYAALFLDVNALNGLIKLPVIVAIDPIYYEDYEGEFSGPYSFLNDSDPIAFGKDASASMRAGVEIIGNGSSGTYRVNFGYALEVFNYYGGLGLGGGLGSLDCLLFGCAP